MYIYIPVLTFTSTSRSPLAPLAACYWRRALTGQLPSGRFHLTPRGLPRPTRNSEVLILMAAPFSATSRTPSRCASHVLFVFGASLTEPQLQASILTQRCVTLCLFIALLSIYSTHPFVMQVSSVSYHAASGTVSVGMYRGNVEIWQTDPYIAPALEAPLPAHACVRRQLVEAEAQAAAIGTLLGLTKDGSRRKSRGKEPARSTEDDESAKERHNELLGIVASCRHTIDSLTSSLSEYGLDELRGGEFSEWLCDIGMSKLQTTLKDLGGAGLTLLNVGDVMTYDVTFCDASALLLRAYIAHNKLSKEKAFSPPRDSVLSWNETQTANWIKTLDAPYHCLAKAGWHGAALCSLSPSRVVDACTAWSLSQPRGFGARTRTVPFGVPGAVKFIVMVRQMRSEVDGDKATWVTKWSGTSSIDHQAAL